MEKWSYLFRCGYMPGSHNSDATTGKRQLGRDNSEATTWKRQLGRDNSEATTGKRQLGRDNSDATTGKRHSEGTTRKRQLGSDNSEGTTRTRQLGSDNSEGTTRKRQLGSDNLEATTRKRQLGSDNSEATTRKRQLGSDNSEATTRKRQLVTLIGFRRPLTNFSSSAVVPCKNCKTKSGWDIVVGSIISRCSGNEPALPPTTPPGEEQRPDVSRERGKFVPSDGNRAYVMSIRVLTAHCRISFLQAIMVIKD